MNCDVTQFQAVPYELALGFDLLDATLNHGDSDSGYVDALPLSAGTTFKVTIANDVGADEVTPMVYFRRVKI